ncbi:MAG: SpoIIE family protein phosphatase, partial [Melioribacteraceae bacterium]|nr:SpoIIE family protein phosphatase [Melioribacteraceae bacterium]
AAEKYGKKIIACVDCTGHGVPGAFMSMIGNTLLNDIVNKFGVDDAGEILNMLDKNIIEELNKNVNTGTLDGMDLGLIVYDNVKNTVSYSGAGRPLFYFTNGELTEVKGTRKSIGDIKKDKVFTTEIINIENETMFYFLSDGYIDQNNFEGKKFGTRQFREVITEIHKYDLSKQKEILISRLDEFKGDEPQRDDVTVIGIRI